MQYARPISTTASGSWTASAGLLHQCIDETSPDDSDFIQHIGSAANSTASFGLTSLIAPVSGSHKLHVRARMSINGPFVSSYTLRVTLRCLGSFIAEFTVALSNNTWQTYSHTLSGPEKAAITDYTALSVDIRYETSGDGAGSEAMQVSWFEYEMPADASVGSFSFDVPANIAETRLFDEIPSSQRNGNQLQVYVQNNQIPPIRFMKGADPIDEQDAAGGMRCALSGLWFPRSRLRFVNGKWYGDKYAPTPPRNRPLYLPEKAD